MKRRKRNPTRALKRNAWQAISRYIRTRDPFCISCLMEGKNVPSTQAGHYQYNTERSQSLGGNALWYDPRNLNGQCAACNLYKSGNLASYARYLQTKYGPQILDELYQLWRTPKKFTLDEITEVISQYGR